MVAVKVGIALMGRNDFVGFNFVVFGRFSLPAKEHPELSFSIHARILITNQPPSTENRVCEKKHDHAKE
jgi:hypothetical protein